MAKLGPYETQPRAKKLQHAYSIRQVHVNRDPNPSYFRGRFPNFVNICVHFDTQIWQLRYSGKFCAIEVACNFENLPILRLNPPYFLDVNVGISGVRSKLARKLSRLARCMSCYCALWHSPQGT